MSTAASFQAAPFQSAGSTAPITCQADAGFQAWLQGSGGSLAISTYQAGKVILAGWHNQQMTMLLRQFDKPMGMAVQDNRLALATRHEVLLLADAPDAVQKGFAAPVVRGREIGEVQAEGVGAVAGQFQLLEGRDFRVFAGHTAETAPEGGVIAARACPVCLEVFADV